MVTMTWCGMTPAGASVVGSGSVPYPPRCLIALTASAAAPTEMMPAPMRENSNHREASGLRSWTSAQKARIPHTAASGSAASSTATRSAMMTQVSITAIAAGVYQRRGARSSTMKMTSRGTWVPIWSGIWIRRSTP